MKWEEESQTFLSKTLPFDPGILEPVIWINYNRYTLVNKNSPERVTIDLDLEFVWNDRRQKFERLVIAEVKQDKRKPSPFINVMKRYHIREGSISKYCMGIAFTFDQVKRNNFKRKLITIKHKNLC
jgi:hypothetical protein